MLVLFLNKKPRAAHLQGVVGLVYFLKQARMVTRWSSGKYAYFCYENFCLCSEEHFLVYLYSIWVWWRESNLHLSSAKLMPLPTELQQSPLSYSSHPLTYGCHPLSYGHHQLSYGCHLLSYSRHPLSYGHHPLSYGRHLLSYYHNPLSYGHHPGVRKLLLGLSTSGNSLKRGQ